jgi:putative transposase
MLTAVVVLLRAIGLLCRGHRTVVLENLTLRQQLAALTRTATRPHLRRRDRLFWMLLRNSWRDWRSSLLIVRPDTVVRWHREWLRHRWTVRSPQKRPGRPQTDAAIRAPVRLEFPIFSIRAAHFLRNWPARTRLRSVPRTVD